MTREEAIKTLADIGAVFAEEMGCTEIVVQGDTLCDPYAKNYPPERTMRTPAKMGVLM